MGEPILMGVVHYIEILTLALTDVVGVGAAGVLDLLA
jgi:hypothetical protein